jgi:hypothetical protein
VGELASLLERNAAIARGDGDTKPAKLLPLSSGEEPS